MYGGDILLKNISHYCLDRKIFLVNIESGQSKGQTGSNIILRNGLKTPLLSRIKFPNVIATFERLIIINFTGNWPHFQHFRFG